MPNIMKVRGEANDLILMLEEAEGEFTTEIAKAFDALVQTGQGAVAILADVCDEVEARGKARKDRAKELSELAKRDESIVDNTKKTIIRVLDALGVKTLTVGGLSVTKSDGRESIEIIDESLIPDKYKKATIVVPAGKVDLIETVLGESVDAKIAISKTAIMDEIKASNGTIGIAGAAVVKNPFLIKKG